MRNDDTWLRIEAEALAQVRAELDNAPPLTAGDYVAWSLTQFGRTDGLSVVHRVGQPAGEFPTTLCGDQVPEPILRVPLSPRLIHSLGSCQYCEAAQALRSFAA